MNAELYRPLVSVLMSVYNSRHYFSVAVESILAQTMRTFELILVDDGSTDGVSELCKDYASRDSRVRLLQQENQGLSRALNAGLQLARGDFIARMDSDDIAHPMRLDRQLNYLRQHPEIVCVGAFVNIIDEDGDIVGVLKRATGPVEIEHQLMAGVGGAIIHPTAMIRRDSIRAVGGYDERYRWGQDFDLWMRLSEIGKLANMPEVLLDWRQHKDGAGYAFSAQQYSVVESVLKETYSRRGLPNDGVPMPPSFVRKAPTDRHLQLSRLAFEQGNSRIATKHAKRALPLLRPFSNEWIDMTITASGGRRWKVSPLKLLRRLNRCFSRLRYLLLR